MATLEQIGKDLLGTLTKVFTGQDGTIKASPDEEFRLIWCQPGIPFSEEDFGFAAANGNTVLTAEQLKAFAKQQFNFSMAVDFLPSINGVLNNDDQQAVYRAGGNRLSSTFKEIVTASRVLNKELSDDEKAKLDKFRAFLYTTEKNIVTGADRPTDGPVLQIYKDKYKNYLAASREYRMKQIQALSATGAAGVQAVNEFLYLGQILEEQVTAAYDDWVSAGYRNEVKDIFAYIDQTTCRSLTAYKQQILERIRMAEVTDLTTGNPYLAATVIPGNFASSSSWTSFHYDTQSFKSTTEWASSSWSGGGGINLGFWSAGGNAGGSNYRNNESLEVNNFKLSFSATQVLIVRPWFSPEFLTNRGWTLKQGANWPHDDGASDGGKPPKGQLPAYATVALFIKDLQIESEDFEKHFSEHRETIQAGFSGGWGPFSFSGSYSRSSGGTDLKVDSQKGRISVGGMQLIGFLCRLVPKSPNPLEGHDDAEFQ